MLRIPKMSQSQGKRTSFACRANVHRCTAPCNRCMIPCGAMILIRGCTGGKQKVNRYLVGRDFPGIQYVIFVEKQFDGKCAWKVRDFVIRCVSCSESAPKITFLSVFPEKSENESHVVVDSLNYIVFSED